MMFTFFICYKNRAKRQSQCECKSENHQESGQSANYSPPPSLLDNKVTYYEKIPSDSKEQMIIVGKYCFIMCCSTQPYIFTFDTNYYLVTLNSCQYG